MNAPAGCPAGTAGVTGGGPVSTGQAVAEACDGASVVQRLEVARAMTLAADAKASGLLTAAGVLAAAGGVLAGSRSGGPVAVAGALVTGPALVVALIALLLVLSPRGGRPGAWLPGLDPQIELARVSRIVAAK